MKRPDPDSAVYRQFHCVPVPRRASVLVRLGLLTEEEATELAHDALSTALRRATDSGKLQQLSEAIEHASCETADEFRARAHGLRDKLKLSECDAVRIAMSDPRHGASLAQVAFTNHCKADRRAGNPHIDPEDHGVEVYISAAVCAGALAEEERAPDPAVSVMLALLELPTHVALALLVSLRLLSATATNNAQQGVLDLYTKALNRAKLFQRLEELRLACEDTRVRMQRAATYTMDNAPQGSNR